MEAQSDGRMENISFINERGIFYNVSMGMCSVYVGNKPEMARIAIQPFLKEFEDSIIDAFIKSIWSKWVEFMMIAIPMILTTPKYNLAEVLDKFHSSVYFQLHQYFPIRELLSTTGTEILTYQELGNNSPMILRLIAHYRPIIFVSPPPITVIPLPDPAVLGFPQTADYLNIYLLHQQCPLPLWGDKEFWKRRGYESRKSCLRGETTPILSFRYYKEYHLPLEYHQGRGLLCALSFLFPLSALNMELLILGEKVKDFLKIKAIYGLMEGNIAHLTDDLPVCEHVLRLKQQNKQWTLQYDHPDFYQGALQACEIIGDCSIVEMV
jgi:hypothetical protein